jgi:molybdopterin-guanine dinucleotide biosynthesis protein A
MNDIAGAVLAGGQSRRFGSPKAFAKQNGKYFFAIAVAALRPVAKEIYIVSHPALWKEFCQKTNEMVILDDEKYRGQGPLAGIYTVMKRCSSEWVFVLPCDMPYMRPEVAEKLATYADPAFDAVVCTHADRIEPLVAIYHCRVLATIAALLDEGERRMQAFLARCRVRYVNGQDIGGDEMIFRNVNTPEEYDDIVT